MIGTIGKIFKGVGRGLSGKDDELNAGANALFSKVSGEKTAMYQHILPYKLNPKVAGGIAAAALVGTAGEAAIDSRHMAQMGNRIQAGSLSGMTSSVQLSKGIQDLQDGKDVVFNNSMRNDGAEGDIVFALHNMR